jgi:hypothetical protein
MSQGNDVATTFQRYAIQAANAYKYCTTVEEDTQECAEFLLALKHRSVVAESHDLTPTKDEFSDMTYQCLRGFSQSGNQKPSNHDSESIVINSSTEQCHQGKIGISWESMIEGSQLVSMSDRDLVPDALFVSMAQMRPCTLTESDRVGCYKSRPEAFAGLCCKHCGGQPGFGKYFPETVRSLAQTTTSQTILKHIGSKCRFCPPYIRQAVLELQRQQVWKESGNSSRPRYGSRKIFFQRIWSRLHTPHCESNRIEDYTPDQTPEHSDIEDEASEMNPVDLISSTKQLTLFPAKSSMERKTFDLPLDTGEAKLKRAKLEITAN